jgi:iron(III) transport system substrate-binding protein
MRYLPIFLISFCVILSSCSKPARTVVIYTAVDQEYSEPILKEFTRKTGIQVLAVYDVEATKTVGLVNRLIAEKDHPQADVFWNNEFAQAILLKEKKVLGMYRPVSSLDIPAQYADPDCYWTGLGARARVLLVNTKKIPPEKYPKSIYDMVDSGIPGNKIGISNPLFGTALTHAAVLYSLWGQQKAKDYYVKLKERGVRVADGNSVVRDLVVNGQLAMGIVDTDDAMQAIKKNACVKMIYPDQDTFGTLVFSNTVSLVAGAPHSEEAQELMEYLLTKEVENKLIAAGYFQFSLRDLSGVKAMKVSFPDILISIESATSDLREIYLR